MANPEHLAILNQGVEAWNRWRKNNGAVKPDLAGVSILLADLSDVNFAETDLRQASLAYANLSSANMAGANLVGADLSAAILFNVNLDTADLAWTKMRGAKLVDACLTEAKLSGTILVNADLEGAILHGTLLHSVSLDDANLNNTVMAFTKMDDVDLRNVKGLDGIRHDAPSSIGIDTIYRSGGKIPESFLRGAGVPEEFIVYMRSLVNNPIEYYSCFISYSSQDEEFARRLHTDLQAANVRCWFAPHDMPIGAKIRDHIDESIRVYDKLLLILSSNSIFSNWVEKEVETAFEQEQPNRKNRTVLFPIRLDDEVMDTNKAWAADIRRARHIGDFSRWKDHDAYQRAFDRLLRDLKSSAKA